MSHQWRIFLVEDDESVQRDAVNALREDGYIVQRVATVADAVRILWSEEFDLVVYDVRAGGSDGFELLQWLRAYRSRMRMIMVGPLTDRGLALEQGAASFLERPLHLQTLKDELRRLLQQTGFSANLESFDLLDVIQVINMSRSNIALLVNTGLEEQGVLRFQKGELIWAEYGILSGEEAFFALAAYKNGTVVQQPWYDRMKPNVTQPLSRLILKALQYRTKYASNDEGYSSEGKDQREQGEGHEGQYETGTPAHLSQRHDEIDDRPFVVAVEPPSPSPIPVTGGAFNGSESGQDEATVTTETPAKEWWQLTGKTPHTSAEGYKRSSHASAAAFSSLTPHNQEGQSDEQTTMLPPLRKTLPTDRPDLPSWLTDQPTLADLPALRPSPPSEASQVQTAHSTPRSHSSRSTAEWQPPEGSTPNLEQRTYRQTTGSQKAFSSDTSPRREARHAPASPEWQPPEEQNSVVKPTSSPLRNVTGPLPTSEPGAAKTQATGPLPTSTTGQQRLVKRNHNYSALVSALQTLGYSVRGFIAAAVVSLEGQPIAQVAVDDLDISRVCKHFSAILRGALLSLDQGAWGEYEDMIITSADRHIMMRLVGSERNAFQVLITHREADPTESLEIMTNVESAISSALR